MIQLILLPFAMLGVGITIITAFLVLLGAELIQQVDYDSMR